MIEFCGIVITGLYKSAKLTVVGADDPGNPGCGNAEIVQSQSNQFQTKNRKDVSNDKTKQIKKNLINTFKPLNVDRNGGVPNANVGENLRNG